MTLRKIFRALKVASGILVKEMDLGPFLLKLFGGLALVVGVIYGLILWNDPQFFEKEDERSIKLHAYAEKMSSVIPSLLERDPFDPKDKIPEDKFVIWYFGEQAKYFSNTHIRPENRKEPGYKTHVGFGGVEYPSYTFRWDYPNEYLEKFYSDDFCWERAGFLGKLPWADPRMVVLIKPVEAGEGERIYSISGSGSGQITIRRFGYHVWLVDVKNDEVMAYRTFLPDPWPEKVSFTTFSRRRRQTAMKDEEGNLIAKGNTNYLGSNRELLQWIESIFERQPFSVRSIRLRLMLPEGTETPARLMAAEKRTEVLKNEYVMRSQAS